MENGAGSHRADYTVFDESLTSSHDLELAAVFERWDDFPKGRFANDRVAIHVDLENPRLPIEELQRQVASDVRRILKKHARRTDYPPYWLSIYANVSMAFYDLPPDYVAQVVADKLRSWPPNVNLGAVFVVNPNDRRSPIVKFDHGDW